MKTPYIDRQRPLSKEIAACAAMTALLIGGQAAFAPIAGIEIVTVLLLTFSWSFGPRAGVWTAAAFSLLRCLLWGFHPPAIALYLLYYPLFALLFGLLGRASRRQSRKGAARLPGLAVLSIDFVLAAIAAACAFCAGTDFLKLSVLAVGGIKALLWAVFGCCCTLFLLLNGLTLFFALRKKDSPAAVLPNVIAVTALAALCTVCFTLLDDIITPLYYGWGLTSAAFLTYFYGSFLALAPQTLCAIVSVSVLFLPFTNCFDKIANGRAVR